MLDVLKIYKVEHTKAENVCLQYEVWIYDPIVSTDTATVELFYVCGNGTKQALARFSGCKDCKEAYMSAMERLLMHAETR